MGAKRQPGLFLTGVPAIAEPEEEGQIQGVREGKV